MKEKLNFNIKKMGMLQKNVSWQILFLVGILLFPVGRFMMMKYSFNSEVGYLFYYTSGILVGMALADLFSRMVPKSK